MQIFNFQDKNTPTIKIYMQTGTASPNFACWSHGCGANWEFKTLEVGPFSGAIKQGKI